MKTERFETIVIGGGQAGLTVGYELQRAGRPFVILDANERVGDAWRKRYDSLRLFTPVRYSGLRGRRFPAAGSTTVTKDEMADYLESYALHFSLPVRNGIHADGLARQEDGYVVSAGDRRFESDNVVVASGAHQEPRVPAFARDLDPAIVQVHSSAYRNPSELRDGGVLVVGAGNSGADIAMELVADHPTWLSGPDRGHVPVNIDSGFARHLVFPIVRFIGMHVQTRRTPLGRKAIAKAAGRGGPLVRVKPKDLVAAGVQRVPKTVGALDGAPVLEDGQVLDVTNIIWCTGFRHDLSWIDVPIFGEDGAPVHERGVVTSEPGLYFVGLPFQFSAVSDLLPGIGRDAAYVVKQLTRRTARGTTRVTVAA